MNNFNIWIHKIDSTTLSLVSVQSFSGTLPSPLMGIPQTGCGIHFLFPEDSPRRVRAGCHLPGLRWERGVSIMGWRWRLGRRASGDTAVLTPPAAMAVQSCGRHLDPLYSGLKINKGSRPLLTLAPRVVFIYSLWRTEIQEGSAACVRITTAACVSGGRAVWPVTGRLLVRSPAPPSVSRCPMSKTPHPDCC